MEVNQIKNEVQNQLSLQKNKQISDSTAPFNTSIQAQAMGMATMASSTVQISEAGIASFEENHFAKCSDCQERYATTQASTATSTTNTTKSNDDAKAILEEARKRITGGTNANLSKKEFAELRELQFRDREVRTHEQAHLAAAGSMAKSGAKFTFKTGPDGKQYAVEGEVAISLSEGQTPQETMARARTIRAAAMAPANPSSQDRSVAAQAVVMESKAQAELLKMSQEVKNNLKKNSAQSKQEEHPQEDQKVSSDESEPQENTSSPQAIQAYQSVQSAI